LPARVSNSMITKKAIVFANGDCTKADVALAQPSHSDFIVCVDGGLRHCLEAGLVPNLLLGDMDSIGKSEHEQLAAHAIETIQYSPKKAASDLHLTLDTLAERGFGNLVLLGISGGRTDHMLFNWMLLANPDWHFSAQIIDHSVVAELIRPDIPFERALKSGTTLSLLPLGSAAVGVVINGVEYPLDNVTLPLGDTLGLSNVVEDNPGGSAIVKALVREGLLLVLVSR